MKLYTVQIARYRKALALGVPFVDTSIKTGKSEFMPTWDMVMGYKQGTVSEARYTEMYYDLMRQRYRANRQWWLAFLRDQPSAAIGCFCTPGVFCHRLLLVDIFKKICERNDIPFEYAGELA